MTLNLQNKGFCEFFLRFRAATHIFRVNCTEMAEDGPGQPAYEIFSIEPTFLTMKVLISQIQGVFRTDAFNLSTF